jgi:hypothetical protein
MDFRYIKFWWKALNSKGHGTHSPFVYDFIINVLNDDRFFYINALHAKKNNQDNLQKIDRLLFKMIDYYHCSSILSINATRTTNFYLQQANPCNKVLKATAWDVEKMIKADFMYVNFINEVEDVAKIINPSEQQQILVVNKPHTVNQLLWNKCLANKNNGCITINLYHLGILVKSKNFKVQQHFDIRY